MLSASLALLAIAATPAVASALGAALLQPLVEASGAAFGDAVAGGSFCHDIAVVAVVESISLTVSLLAGPTPHLVRRLRAPAPAPGLLGGLVTAAVAADLDSDGSDELVLAVQPASPTAPPMILAFRFGQTCENATIIAAVPVSPGTGRGVVALLHVPRVLAAAGLVATLDSGSHPFLLLGLSASGTLSINGTSDFGISSSTGSWVAAASSGNRTSMVCESSWAPKSHVVHPCSPLAAHPTPVLIVANSAATVFCLGVNTTTGAVGLLSNTTIAHLPSAAAIVDFAGTNEPVVVLVSSQTGADHLNHSEATMLALPSLRTLGQQQVDSNHSWSSVAAVDLGSAYGATHDNDGQNVSIVTTGSRMQQLLGLRAFPRLNVCPGAVPGSQPWQAARSHQYGNQTFGIFCCEENLGGNCLNWTTSNIPCCLSPGTQGGCGDALPCTLIGSGEFVVSLLVFGDGALWLPRSQAIATSSKLQLDSPDPWTDGADRPGGAGLEGYLQMMKRVLDATHSSAYAAGVCDSLKSAQPTPWLDNLTVTSYQLFVELLHATRDFEVDGRHQLRMWLILPPPTEADSNNMNCQPPADSPLTEFNETAIFANTGGYYTQAGYIAWSELVGRLARQFPHLMGWNVDDMSHDSKSDHFGILFSSPATDTSTLVDFADAPRCLSLDLHATSDGTHPGKYAQPCTVACLLPCHLLCTAWHLGLDPLAGPSHGPRCADVHVPQRQARLCFGLAVSSKWLPMASKDQRYCRPGLLWLLGRLVCRSDGLQRTG